LNPRVAAIAHDHARIRVFIGSPGDVGPERDRIADVIGELNRTLGSMQRVYIEPVRWETHAWPGFGEDAQDVINGQVGAYDVFIGVMWRRIGTTTARALSGTVEEFERAYEQWREHKRPSILFYFNSAPFTPNADDLEQYAAVLEFKRVLATRGALYREYSTLPELESLVREHLFHEIPTLLRAGQIEAATDAVGDEDEDPDAADPDVLELRLRLETKLEFVCNEILRRYATVGSLRRDGLLTTDQARIAARIQTLDPAATLSSAGDARFLEEAERFVDTFRAVIFDAHVRRSLPPGWQVRQLEQRGTHRPDWLAVKGSRSFRIVPRIAISAESKVRTRALSRLARGRDDPAGLSGRLLVLPDNADIETGAAGDDPRVVKFADLRDVRGG
jgi:hypothetical protein